MGSFYFAKKGGNQVAQMRMSAPKALPLLRLDPFKGMDVSGIQIDNHHSPDALNVNLNEKGALNKRTGYERVMDLGTGAIKGMFLYHKSDGTEKFLVAHGGKLYVSGIPNNGMGLVTWQQDDLAQTWESEV
jgi:hypothetical protein